MLSNFDFSKLPTIDRWSLAIDPLEDAIRTKFSKYNHAYGRYVCSVRFISHSRNPHHTPGEHRESIQKGFVRASLSDFKTIVEVLPFDLRQMGNNDTPMDIHTPENPLFSFLSEIRNQNIHFYTPDISKRNKHEVMLGSEELEYTVYGLNLSKDEFLNFNNVKKHWAINDAIAMFDWFEKTQNEYGFREIILHANLQMAQEIVSHHG